MVSRHGVCAYCDAHGPMLDHLIDNTTRQPVKVCEQCSIANTRPMVTWAEWIDQEVARRAKLHALTRHWYHSERV